MNTLQPRIEHLERLAVDDDSPRHEFEPLSTPPEPAVSIKAASMAAERALSFHRFEMDQARWWLNELELSPASRSAWEAIEQHHRLAVQWLVAFEDVLPPCQMAGGGFLNDPASRRRAARTAAKIRLLTFETNRIVAELRNGGKATDLDLD